MLHHNLFFLTEGRRRQFERAIFVLTQGLTRWQDVPESGTAPTLFPLPTTAINLPFFFNWIVGFTTAEGFFYIKTNGGIVFSIRQNSHAILFDAFKLVFNTNRKIDSFGGSNKFSVQSVKDLSNVIQFFSFSGLHPLKGYSISILAKHCCYYSSS